MFTESNLKISRRFWVPEFPTPVQCAIAPCKCLILHFNLGLYIWRALQRRPDPCVLPYTHISWFCPWMAIARDQESCYASRQKKSLFNSSSLALGPSTLITPFSTNSKLQHRPPFCTACLALSSLHAKSVPSPSNPESRFWHANICFGEIEENQG